MLFKKLLQFNKQCLRDLQDFPDERRKLSYCLNPAGLITFLFAELWERIITYQTRKK